MRKRGSILVGVLWCLVLLSVVVIGLLHTARMDLSVVKNYGDRVQAHYLALAAVERAKALIYQDAVTRQQTAKSHTGALYDDEKDFHDVPFGRGTFDVLRRAPEADGGRIVYGVSDEESRLNINTVAPEPLTNIVGMTPEIIAAIVDWRDADNAVTPGGAESEYYLGLQPPYTTRNGPLQTVRELLMVRGITPDLLLGNDENQNGFLDSDEEPEEKGAPPGAAEAPRDPGWSALLTVVSTDKNVSAAGQDRVNAQTADQATLMGVPGMTAPIAQAIISYRGQNPFKSLGDLLSVTPQNQNQNGRGTRGAAGPGGNPAGGGGAPVISQDLLMGMADDLTVSDTTDLTGLININTAGREVLVCLPGIDPPLAQAIIGQRQSDGFFDNVAGVLKVSGMTTDIFKQIAPLITARSETYRIIGEGTVKSGGARQRIEAIVHIGRRDIETLSYRDDL